MTSMRLPIVRRFLVVLSLLTVLNICRKFLTLVISLISVPLEISLFGFPRIRVVSLMHKCLGRALIGVEWIFAFLEEIVENLCRAHSPVLRKCGGYLRTTSIVSFIFWLPGYLILSIVLLFGVKREIYYQFFSN